MSKFVTYVMFQGTQNNFYKHTVAYDFQDTMNLDTTKKLTVAFLLITLVLIKHVQNEFQSGLVCLTKAGINICDTHHRRS